MLVSSQVYHLAQRYWPAPVMPSHVYPFSQCYYHVPVVVLTILRPHCRRLHSAQTSQVEDFRALVGATDQPLWTLYHLGCKTNIRNQYMTFPHAPPHHICNIHLRASHTLVQSNSQCYLDEEEKDLGIKVYPSGCRHEFLQIFTTHRPDHQPNLIPQLFQSSILSSLDYLRYSTTLVVHGLGPKR